jgi:diamine N-acetyltransferase
MLIGKRVKLRPLEEADLPLLAEWRNQPEVWARFFNKFPISFSGQRDWYKALLEERRKLLLIIEAIESSKPIGTIGFDNIDSINQRAEYGNLLIGHDESRHLGFATEASILLLSYGFDRLNLNRVFLHVLADNVKTVNLYKRLGFREEGLLREAIFDQGKYKDVVVMGILRREYRSLHALLELGF